MIAFNYLPNDKKSEVEQVYNNNLSAINEQKQIDKFINAQIEQSKIETAINVRHDELLEKGHIDV